MPVYSVIPIDCLKMDNIPCLDHPLVAGCGTGHNAPASSMLVDGTWSSRQMNFSKMWFLSFEVVKTRRVHKSS